MFGYFRGDRPPLVSYPGCNCHNALDFDNSGRLIAIALGKLAVIG
ncbi:hypothetical protein [Nostoc sp.]